MSDRASSSPPSSPGRDLAQHVSDLELRVAYHERLNQDLSDQVYALHRRSQEHRTT